MSNRSHTRNQPGGTGGEVRLLLDEGLVLYRQGELLAALAEWEHALELDENCARARQYIDFVKKNFDLLNERFHLDDQGRAPSSDTSFAIESTESTGAPGQPIDARTLRKQGKQGKQDAGSARPGSQRQAASDSTQDGWPVGLPGVARWDDSDSGAGAGSGSAARSGPMKKLDPARLAEVLPRPEDDDLLELANASRAADVPFDLATPSPTRHRGDRHRAMTPDHDTIKNPATRASQPSDPFPPLGAGAASRGKGRRTLSGKREVSDTEQTTERQMITRRPQARLDDQLTPLPELPGEGAVTVGASPDLDDAWTLDLDLDASSWGSPGSASLPTSKPLRPASTEQPTLRQPVRSPSPGLPADSRSKVAERVKSSFTVEALTGPGLVDAPVAPIVIEESNPFADAPLQLDDLADDVAGLDLGIDHRPVAATRTLRKEGTPERPDEVDLEADLFDRTPPPPPPTPFEAALTQRIDTKDLELGSFDGGAATTRSASPVRHGTARRATVDPARLEVDPARPEVDPARPTVALASRRASTVPDERQPSYPSLAPLDSLAHDLLDALDRAAVPGESKRDRLRRRMTALIERAQEEHLAGNHTAAVLALDLAITEDPDSAISQKLIQLHRDAMCEIFQAFLGDAGRVPMLAMAMQQLAGEKIESRAAFLLSRVDGFLTIDELLDVSGMSRVEAYRHLCTLTLKGILKIDS